MISFYWFINLLFHLVEMAAILDFIIFWRSQWKIILDSWAIMIGHWAITNNWCSYPPITIILIFDAKPPDQAYLPLSSHPHWPLYHLADDLSQVNLFRTCRRHLAGDLWRQIYWARDAVSNTWPLGVTHGRGHLTFSVRCGRLYLAKYNLFLVSDISRK